MDGNTELLKGNTPTLVLAVLKDAPRHGYGIAREIERRSDNALAFKEGTLYPALHALEREGLVVGAWHKENRQSDTVCDMALCLTVADAVRYCFQLRQWQSVAAGQPDCRWMAQTNRIHSLSG